MGFYENKRWGRLWCQHPPQPTTCPEHVGANSGETTLERVKPIWYPLPFLLSSQHSLGNGEMAANDEGIGATASVLLHRRATERLGKGGDSSRDPPAMRGVYTVHAAEVRCR